MKIPDPNLFFFFINNKSTYFRCKPMFETNRFINGIQFDGI